ncbi:helix-turn-helix domain-containing protein [Candidatus Bathyarchaeota archaeon]|nr:helix-turn-helix domain-containing protein [Candidatus Bathyarchaeota archaeon]
MPKNPSSLRNIDRLIHEPTRLMIMTQLYVVESADFLFLQNQLQMTPGNLSSHLSKLEEAGYVEIVKEFIERKPHTALTLTKKGRSAFKEYQQNLKQVFTTLPK